MQRELLAGIAIAVGLAVVAAAGTAFLVATSLAPAPEKPAPGAGPGSAGGPSRPGEQGMQPVVAEQATWLFAVRANPPAPGTGRAGGSIIVFLSKARGDANASATNGSISLEVAGVSWDARSLAPPANGTILDALNAAFNAQPPLALSRAALSRSQDAVELVLPPALNVSSVVVHAPASGEFLVVHWPTGDTYAWTPPQGAWVRVQDVVPTLLARPLVAG